jgi:UV DNA damage endonuclease
VRRLGFAVKVLGEGGLPSHDTRRWQSHPHLSRSLEHLDAILRYLDRNDIRMYRMASALAPYASHPDMPQFRRQVEECEAKLARCGALARRLGIRLSFHPGQYTVLNSERDDVRAAARADVELQARILDAMGLDVEAVVVVHVGGAAGGVRAGLERFLAGYEALSAPARARLVVENDDRTFDLEAVLELHARTGIRVVWDALHHRCHNPGGIPEAEALARAVATWPDGVVPKIHYSSPRLDIDVRRTRQGRRVRERIVIPPLRAHADLVDPIAFEAFLRGAGPGRDFDVMLEAKAKDLALLALRTHLPPGQFVA